MATATEIKRDMQPVLQRIKSLRRQLRGWILVDGLARLLIVAVLLALADMLLDRMFKMDVPQRAIMLGLIVSTLVCVGYLWIVRPFAAAASDDALVLQVEDKHRDGRQSLISGFQLARESHSATSGMSPALVQATIDAGNHRAQSIDFASALNQAAGARNRLLLWTGLLICVGLGIGAATNPFLKTWFNRNVLLGTHQWPQATYLEIVGAADGVLDLDRGADHELIVIVTERSRVQNVSVVVEFETGAKRSIQSATATGRLDGREHRLTLRSLNSEFRLRALGGDATTPWVAVRLVEPIDVRQLNLVVRLPSYAGTEQPLLGGGPHSVLVGSTLQIDLESNLPVETALLKWNESSPAGTDNPISVDGQIDLQKIDATHFRTVLPDPENQRELRGGKYSIELIGEDGRRNFKPTAFQISIADDKPPRVAASLSGIGGLVVPQAQIPLSFKATDRYGLVATSVEYLWKTGDENTAPQSGIGCLRSLAPSDVSWIAGEHEFAYSGAELFDLRPLNIQPGEVLRLNVQAQDNQPTASGIGKSREFLLRIVTEEELRSDLLRREVEQRALFQQERTNQLQLLTDLRAFTAASSSADAANLGQRQQSLIDFQNRQKNVGTNLFQIAQRFAEFLEEAKNNRLDESEKILSDQIEGQSQPMVSLQTRYMQRIIDPIRELDASEIYLAGQALEEGRGQLADLARFADTAGQTAELQEIIVRKMDAILAAMEDSQTYQEIVNQVIALKRLEQGLLDAINTKQGKPGKSDIFDPSVPSPSDQTKQPPGGEPKDNQTP